MDGNCKAGSTLRIAHNACSKSTQGRVEHTLEEEENQSRQTTEFERGQNSKQENSLSSNLLMKAQGHNFTFEAKMNMTKLSRNTKAQKIKRPTMRPTLRTTGQSWSSDSCRGTCNSSKFTSLSLVPYFGYHSLSRSFTGLSQLF